VRSNAADIVYGIGDVFRIYLGVAEELDGDIQPDYVGVWTILKEGDVVSGEGLVAGITGAGDKLDIFCEYWYDELYRQDLQ